MPKHNPQHPFHKKTIKNMWKSLDIQKKYDDKELQDIALSPLQKIDICKICNQFLEIQQDGTYICNTCNVIEDNAVDLSAEWRLYQNEDGSGDPTRCGMPVNAYFPLSSMTCTIMNSSKMSAEMFQIKKMCQWQKYEPREKSKSEDFRIIHNMAQKMNIISRIADYAIQIYHILWEHELLACRKHNKKGILVGCLYMASKKLGFPRTHKELATLLGIKQSITGCGCNKVEQILREIEIQNAHNNTNIDDNEQTIEHNENAPVHNIKDVETADIDTDIYPHAIIERPCFMLGMNEELIMVCKFVCCKIENMQLLQSCTPSSIVGAVIYLISTECNLNITKKQISDNIGVSSVTINKGAMTLQKLLDKIIPRTILEKYASSSSSSSSTS